MFDQLREGLAAGARAAHLVGRKRRRAWRAYRSLLRNDGIAPVSAADRKRISSYAHEVLGGERFAPWLMLYTAFRGRFVEGWIPDDYFAVVLPRINTSYRYLDAARSLNSRLFRSPLFPDLASWVNGVWYDAQGERLSDQRLAEVIFSRGPRAFLKREQTRQGKGVFVLHREAFDPRQWEGSGNAVVQSAIVQHEWMSRIHSGAVNTLRVTTINPPGVGPRAGAAYLRVAQGQAEFIATAEAFRIGVSLESGELAPDAWNENWMRNTVHPDTGFRYSGQVIPHFHEAVRACEDLHRMVPQFGVIGWDVAIDETGAPRIMEWNAGHPGIKFSEAATGPFLTDLRLEQFARRG